MHAHAFFLETIYMFDSTKITTLHEFITSVKSDPSLLLQPELSFFREYLVSLGASVPEPAAASSDPDLIPAESDPLSTKPSPHASEATDAELDLIAAMKSDAAHAFAQNDFATALTLYNDILTKSGASAMLLTKRAEVLLSLRRPKAAIADCDYALELNPSSGKAFRVRGVAYRFLGEYERAHFDLGKAQSIDYDDEVEKIKRFVDKKWAEKKTDHEEFHEPEEDIPTSTSHPSAPSGMPDMGSLFSDPDIASALGNPKVMAALQQMMSNPAAIFQYQNDPEVGPVLMKLMSKMGMGGFGM